MEMKRSDQIAALPKGSIAKDSETTHNSSLGFCCSIEIKGTCLPPWIICNICSLMGSEGRNFEARYSKFCLQHFRILSDDPICVMEH